MQFSSCSSKYIETIFSQCINLTQSSSLQLTTTENRIKKLEECECEKSCRVNGTIHDDGATWEKGCQQCSCVHGEIKCKPTPCASVACKNPVVPAGKCCPVCLSK